MFQAGVKKNMKQEKDYTHFLKESKASDVQGVVNALQQALSTTYALLALTQNAHWNIEGANFRSLHLMFNDQYEDLFDSIDTIAENIRQLQVYVPVNLTKFVEQSGISNPLAPQTEAGWVSAVLAGNELAENVFVQLQIAVKDFPYLKIQDFAIERQEAFSKAIWMLRSTLKGLS